MDKETRVVRPSKKRGHVVDAGGQVRKIPAGWALLEPGDAALSRRIKKDGPTWTVKQKKGRRSYSLGIWAPADRIEALRAELIIERDSPAYQKKLDAGRKRRAKQQVIYAADFEEAVRTFLDFAKCYKTIGREMAKRIAAHAVPVGSGTVARTKRIPIEKRAEAATIAWMRHQTTAYDGMVIPRVKGKRREVRRMLAKRSKQLLNDYRNGTDRPEDCPLANAVL